MEITTIAEMVTTFGFPIVACLIMGWYVKYVTDKNREEVSALNEQHKEEMGQVTEALNNNTMALQRLCDKLSL